MSTSARGAIAYRRMAAQSATPVQLVVMLYDGALRFIAEARAAHDAGRADVRSRALGRAAAIMAECQATLDRDRGGSLAVELERLYGYISGRIVDVTARGDAAALDEVHRLVATLRDGWAQAAIDRGSPTAPGSR